MEDKIKSGYLYDFYGELLNDHQRNVYEMSVVEDLSLSEIAEVCGISRQAVHDLLKRCDHLLLEYEQKLHLVEKFLRIRDDIQMINELTAGEPNETSFVRISQLSSSILEEL